MDIPYFFLSLSIGTAFSFGANVAFNNANR